MNIDTITALVEKKINDAPANLKDFARAQLNNFSKRGFKEIIPDSYKFTNLESFFASLDQSSSEEKNDEEDIPRQGFIFKDGVLTLPKDLPSGVSIKLFTPQSDEFKEIQVETPLSSLHHALLGDGVIIEIAEGTQAEAPIMITHFLSKSQMISPTVFVMAHSGSRVTLVEEIRSTELASSALISETYIKVYPSASVEHISIDRGNLSGINHSSVFADVQNDADFRSFFLSVSGKMNRKNLTINLNAPGANGENHSLFLTNGKEHSDFYTEMNHKSPDTTSNQVTKGILDESSKGIFTGRIHIFPKSQRVSAKQLNKNLLLSSKAQVHSQPQLEIFADDVKCSHGSTTGQLSSDEVFYFQTRGIPAEKAKALIALGFGLEIVQRIKNRETQNNVLSIIRAKLAEKFSIGRDL